MGMMMNNMTKTSQINLKKKSNQFRGQSLWRYRTIGEMLISARENSQLSRVDIAREIKVSEKYLEALEKGRYNDLPSPVYIKNYLRLYSRALGIRWDKIEERYQQEITVYHQHPHTKPHDEARTRPRLRQQKTAIRPHVAAGAHGQQALLIPRLLKIGAFGIVIMVMIVYFAWGVVRLLSPPALVILSPAQDIIVTSPDIVIEGQSEPEVAVEINGQAIGVEPDGRFREELVLRDGLNTIRVTAQSKLSRQNEAIRHVLYDAPEDQVTPPSQEENPPATTPLEE
jgi:transcriptional regulator with XRE-family HTH domain